MMKSGQGAGVKILPSLKVRKYKSWIILPFKTWLVNKKRAATGDRDKVLQLSSVCKSHEQIYVPAGSDSSL